MPGTANIIAMKKIVQQLRLEAGINRVKVFVETLQFYSSWACLSSPYILRRVKTNCQRLMIINRNCHFKGLSGRSGPPAVLPSERPAGPSAERHVVQQQPVQTA